MRDTGHPAVNIAFLTGASCAGKTWTSERLASEHALPILDVDAEVFAPIFTMYRRPELRNSINPTSSWAFLRRQTDFDRRFRLHHREWFTRTGVPAAFVAVGWIYCFREWRIPPLDCRFKLFVLQPSYDDFFVRFRAAVGERFGGAASFFGERPQEQRNEADKHYRQFRDRDVELPAGDEMEYEVCVTAEELIPRVARYCLGDGSRAVPERKPPTAGARP
ncbi:MAG TPA: hypothetical protein VGL09_17050 [Methylomirabilota bacterium]|jgi:hypothetical protein